MRVDEVAALLAKAKAYDNREVGTETLRLWADAFAPITCTLQDAAEAMYMHIRESTAYLLPAHIIANLRRLNESRVNHRVLDDEDYRESPSFVADPKPPNMAEMTAAWADPVRFGLEVQRYKAWLSDYHRGRRAA